MFASLNLIDVPCPLCGDRDCAEIVRAPDRLCGIPGEFRVVQCMACHHAYMNPRPDADSIPLTYPEGYAPHRPGCRADQLVETGKENASTQPAWLRVARMVPGLQRVYRWLSETNANWMPPRPHDQARALDLGCASGKFLSRLREDGWIVQGVEPSSAAVASARALGLDVHEGTLEEACFPDESFDVVFTWMVLEHVPDPVATLREVRRILKPGGMFVFSVPNFGCWEPWFFGRYWIAYELPRHLQHFTVPRLRRMLGEEGFKTERVLHQSNGLNVLGSVAAAMQSTTGFRAAGDRLLDWFWRDPPFLVGMGLLVMAKGLAAICQSGRITVVATKS